MTDLDQLRSCIVSSSGTGEEKQAALTLLKRVEKSTARLQFSYDAALKSAHRLTQLLRATSEDFVNANLALARFKSVADITLDFICIMNLDEELLYMNPAGRTLLGYGVGEDLNGSRLSAFASDEFIRMAHDDGYRIAMEQGAWQQEVELKHRDGHLIPVSMIGIGIKGDDGAPMYFAGVARDMSSRVALEKQLRASLEQERALGLMKSNFVSMVSHEFRTPLGIISVNSELLNRYRLRLTPEQMTGNLAAITGAVKRMTGMMDNILALSRFDTNRQDCNPAPTHLPALLRIVVDEMLSVTDRSHDIALSMDEQGMGGDALVDESILRHALSNLISNACKYSPSGSVVEVHAHRDASDVIVSVTDHGIGIPDADKERLFESFHRGKNVGQIAGTGLGLVIVKRSIDLHGGSIEVESEEGRGATFIMRLPVFSGTASVT